MSDTVDELLMPYGPPKDAERKIFISYRRQDSQHIVGRIYDHLALAFGEPAVFKDVESIPLGSDFRKEIGRSLNGCVIVIVVIGPGWVEAKDRDGNRRLNEPSDYLRLEIETALKSSSTVFPLVVEGASMPPATALPDELSELAFLNCAEVRNDPDFRADMGKVISAIQPYLKDYQRPTREERSSAIQPML